MTDKDAPDASGVLPHNRTASSTTLSRRLATLALVSTLPLFGFSLFETYMSYRADREVATQRQLTIARSALVGVERELMARIAGLRALALAPSLRRGDIAAFESQARAFLAQSDPGASMALTRATGEIVLAIGPYGHNVEPKLRNEREVVTRVFMTRMPTVSNFYRGTITGAPSFSVDVPVLDETGQVIFDLSLNPYADSLRRLIDHQRLEPDWIVSVLDAAGVIVARLPNGEKFVGSKASATLVSHVLAEPEGTLNSTTLDGIKTLTAFSRSPEFGWSVAIGLPISNLSAVAWRSAIVTLVVGVVLTAASLLLARSQARRIASPIDRLRHLAALSGSTSAVAGKTGQADSHPPVGEAQATGLGETDEVARALAQAAEQRAVAEAALALNERRVRALIDVAAQVTWTTDADGKIVDDSPSWRAFTGQSIEGWIGSGWLNAIHPDDRVRVLDEWQRCVAEPRPYETEYRLAYREGGWRWTLARGVPLRDPSGAVAGWVGMNTDVHERRAAEEALAESENRLQLAREAAEFGVWDWDLSGNLIRWSPDQWRMHGLSQDGSGPSFESWCACVHDDDRADMLAEVLDAIARPDKPLDSAYRVTWPNGSVRWLMSKGKVLRDANGSAVRMVGINMDITARKTTEDSLRELTRDLETRVADAVAAREAAHARAAQSERMQALGQLAGGVAHDFNNLLQAIQSGAGLIERKADDPGSVRRLAAMLLGTTARGASVTRRLLSFARQDELVAEPMAPAALLNEMREVLEHTLGGTIVIAVTTEPGRLPWVFADRGQLESVLINLATNARDAMPNGGTLTLSAGADWLDGEGSGRRRAVRLEISDTGLGMDAATLARATEPFFTTKPVGRGTGLGLSMARNFVEQSEGSMHVASALGEGTVVTIILPAVEEGQVAEVPAPSAAPTRMVPEGTGRAFVLLVDDDELVREVLAEQMTLAGFRVMAVSDGATALAVLDAGQAVDLLLTDLSMPTMDGVALIRSAQAIRPDLPAVLLTGYADEGATLASSGAMSGSFSLLRKPITAAMLTRRVSELLSERQTHLESH